ncbi:dnaJ homolog subfamily C member 21-like [Agrilus planipennis]|uniref:DnaJ homolog subfamily C member 21 n=1 Tax=Agrilus planipennis TaxID=224129 RepID=A0A7F5R479_AGRPL|nr:dnaJ homolog subfamily C member 21-like [Agrilus planipennis]
MRCHYDVLGIPKDADDSQIKSAYKKLALKWHPDKNLGNAEYAKEEFQLVQQAYEILSDRQERAWYDNHREQILRGSNSEFKDNSLDVFQYFTTTCFKGYGDDLNGFYVVYRNVFEKIAKEDLEFMEDKDEFCQIPSFGDSKSDYDEVVGPFYAYWMSYSTKKSYVWLDPYNLSDIRDRKIFKIAEKKNKKIRQQAKKERNDEIRNLVAFVKKRDKRVQEHAKKIQAKILENRQKYEQISKQKRLERKKLHDDHTQAEWTKFDNVKSELEEIERRLAEQFGEQLSDSEEDQEDSEDENSLYCVACNKIFKTPKALQNHEASKKHKENLQILQETMLDEENDISESSEEQENDISETLEKNPPQEVIKGDNHSDYLISDKEGIHNASDSSFSTTETKKKRKNKKMHKSSTRHILVENENKNAFQTFGKTLESVLKPSTAKVLQ